MAPPKTAENRGSDPRGGGRRREGPARVSLFRSGVLLASHGTGQCSMGRVRNFTRPKK